MNVIEPPNVPGAPVTICIVTGGSVVVTDVCACAGVTTAVRTGVFQATTPTAPAASALRREETLESFLSDIFAPTKLVVLQMVYN